MTAAKKSLTKLVRDGATSVEEIHKKIADLPLKFLEENDLLKEQAKKVRRAQDRTIGAIYDLIRDVNQKVGTFASELRSRAAVRRSAHHRAAVDDRHDSHHAAQRAH
jgi:hypothetical protein